jgi:hypothetical protein
MRILLIGIVVFGFSAFLHAEESMSDEAGFDVRKIWLASDSGVACQVFQCMNPVNKDRSECVEPLNRFASMSELEQGKFIAKCPVIQERAQMQALKLK